MSGRTVVPPHHIVALMRERASGFVVRTDRKPNDEDIKRRDQIARALTEAWVEGVNAGFSVDDSMLEIAEAVGYTVRK